MDGDVENGDISGGNCFMNSHTISKAHNMSSIDYTHKRYGNDSNEFEM